MAEDGIETGGYHGNKEVSNRAGTTRRGPDGGFGADGKERAVGVDPILNESRTMAVNEFVNFCVVGGRC